MMREMSGRSAFVAALISIRSANDGAMEPDCHTGRLA